MGETGLSQVEGQWVEWGEFEWKMARRNLLAQIKHSSLVWGISELKQAKELKSVSLKPT